ncbi:hypothetical protein C1645_873656 [Glomus cerebriforme]|uniref:Uncharacterized protein n=1 Tax=Glomus cerebriforme TaxID=658196 RepID=A0A397TGE7_9GLOM|nr:hypothetical protein C1645_873656 [Glomus cerebriforme]
MSETETQTNSPIAEENSLIHEQVTPLIPLNQEDVLVPDVADKHPRDMPEMAFVIAFCIQYNEAVGNLNFLPEELEDAIVSREPVDLVERVHRYFLRNTLNVSKIIDKRYWVKKLSQHLDERIEKKEFILSYNPFDRTDNIYHELSNFEKVMILKELVMWQIKGSEKIQSMWQSRESERIRPVEIEVLGVDSKGSTYFYLGVGARVYREIPSADGTQQCIWEALTTSLQDLKDLISARVEIDPDRSEEERLLYKRISKSLIPEIESQIKDERAIEYNRTSGKKLAKNTRYNKSPRKVPVDSSVEETESADYENTQAGVEDDITASDVEPILSVSMWSVTRPSTNLQPAQTVHDVRCFPTSQGANTTSNGATTSVNSASQWNEGDVDAATTTPSSINGNIEIGLMNAAGNKRRMEEETSDDNDSSDSDNYSEPNKRVKFGQNLDDDDDDDDYNMMFESYDNDTSKRSKVKGKGVLRNEPHDNSILQNVDINKSIDVAIVKPKDKGKGVLRHEEIIEGNYVIHESNHEIFRPGPEEQIRLEWSLNHAFFEELEIFGENSDSELSECCDACIIEVDHLMAH